MTALKRIGLFFDRTYVDAHPCFTELAKEFSARGYYVDLYCINPHNAYRPVFFDEKIRVFDFPESKFQKLEFWYKILRTNDRKYISVFGTPYKGVALAHRLAKRTGVPLYYLADEIFDPLLKHHKVENWDLAKRLDIAANAYSKATIALGEERFLYQKGVNSLSDSHKHFVITNSTGGDVRKVKSNFFRDLLNIADDKPIVLFAGTLHWELAKKLYEKTKSYTNKNYHLVFHGRSYNLIGSGDHPFIKTSSTPIPANLLNYAFSSADIGLVLYDKNITAEKNNGLTGGKIPAYLKCQLPLIMSNLVEFKEFDKSGVGEFWDGNLDFDEVVNGMLPMLPEMKSKIPAFYKEHYDYQKQFKPFYDFFDNELSNIKQ